MSIDDPVKNLSNALSLSLDSVLKDVRKQAEQMIADAIKQELTKFDASVSQALNDNFTRRIAQFNFPEESIPVSALRFANGETISGDNIVGGIIRKFNSVGIQDSASDCRVTIMDDTTVVENQLVVNGIRVVGQTSLEGPINFFGDIDKNSDFYQTLISDTADRVGQGFNDTMFTGFSNKVFELIKTQGISLDKLLINGKNLVEDGNTLASSILNSNLRSVGTLKELQVDGEFMVNNGSLYVGKKRVGVNTVEPGAALTVWDSEVEFEVGKSAENTGYIGLPRKQTLVLGTNNHNNLRLRPDGAVETDKVFIGSMSFESSATPPNTSGTKGSVVFNSNPSEGGPMGWVCLGGAKWANFGIID